MKTWRCLCSEKIWLLLNKDGILDKKVAPEELEFTKKNLLDIIDTIKSVQSSDKYKKIIGSGDDYLRDKKYLPETLYKRIKSVLTRDSLIEQITAIYSSNDDDAILDAIKQFVNDNYQDIKYTPFIIKLIKQRYKYL